MHQNYFSVSAGLFCGLTSPKAVDPYLLYFEELMVLELGRASCLAGRKELLATRGAKLYCVHTGLNSGSPSGHLPAIPHKRDEGLSGPLDTFSGIWTGNVLRENISAGSFQLRIFLLKK